MMLRRHFLASSAALALSPVAQEASAQARTLIIAAPTSGPSNANIYYAQQQGWFSQAGLDVTIQPISGGSVGMAALIGGSVHVVDSNVLSMCLAHAKQVPVAIMTPGSMYDTNRNVSELLVVAPGSSFRSPKELNGKSVAVPGLSDLLSISIKGIIDQNGGDSTTVHFIEMPPPSMVNALQAGKIDAAGMYDPFLSAALAVGAKVIAKPYDSIAPKFMVEGYFTYRPWADEHRAAVAAFTDACIRASVYINAHQRDVVPMISQYTKIPIDVLAKMRFSDIATTLDPAMMQPMIDAAAKYKVIPRAFPAKEIIFST